MRLRPFTRGFLGLWIPAVLSSQSQVVRLGAADSTPDEFTRIVGLRELADGRVLISDRRDNRVAVVSFAGVATRQVGSVGSGPGEYRAAGTLIRMPGDSTALIDVAAGRWLLFRGSEPVAVVPPDNFAVHVTHTPVGISAAYAYGFVMPADRLSGQMADTMALVRVSRRSAKVDTLSFLAAPMGRRGPPQKSSTSSFTIVPISISPWTAGEQALLFDDGWIGIARLHPYRVDWIPPDGQSRTGKPLRASDPPFTDNEKRAHMGRIAAANGKPPEEITSKSDWPDVIPPFTSMFVSLGDLSPALFHGPSGQLVIRRLSSAAEPEQRYDVIDRQSKLLAQIVMPAREVLVGIGKAHLYTALTDDDGIQRIRRYRWPVK